MGRAFVDTALAGIKALLSNSPTKASHFELSWVITYVSIHPTALNDVPGGVWSRIGKELMTW